MSSLRSIRNIARTGAFLALRTVARRISPAVPNNRIESAVRWLGFFEAPEPAEVIANYLRGYLLFGRENPYGDWFHWYRLPARSVITRKTAHVPRRQRPLLNRNDIEFRYNQDFEVVIRHCQEGRDGWLTDKAVAVYRKMHSLGLIGTVGTYHEGQLTGGFWGLSVGPVFAIMSMFHLEKSGGSLALAALADSLLHGGRWAVIDCGGPGYHWDRYGAQNLSVEHFSALVTSQLFVPEDPAGYCSWIQPEDSAPTQSTIECAMASSRTHV
jgi:leucyl/phenylalanyl-tRNA--protein transferase